MRIEKVGGRESLRYKRSEKLKKRQRKKRLSSASLLSCGSDVFMCILSDDICEVVRPLLLFAMDVVIICTDVNMFVG